MSKRSAAKAPEEVRTRLAGTQVKSVRTATGSAAPRSRAKEAAAAAKLRPAAPTAVAPTARRENQRTPTSPFTAAPTSVKSGIRTNIGYPLSSSRASTSQLFFWRK